MSKKTKLELTWPGKEERPKLEPRILIEDPDKSYAADGSGGAHGPGTTGNMLIKGDNLLALKALEADYSGKVNCVFIDPPYNTGSAFHDYPDGVEHSLWLSLMRNRLLILKELLTDDGSIWISIDDNEAHYLKVLLDEIFGRNCFVSGVIWKSSDNSNNDAKQFSTDHNHLLVYSKTPGWLSNKTRGSDDKYGHFKNPDKDPRGPWFDGNPLGSPAYRENLVFDLVSPTGKKVKPPKNGWRWSKETLAAKIQTGEIRFTADGNGIRRRTYLREQKGLPPSTLWIDMDQTGHNRQAKFEQKNLFPKWSKEEWFSTPKPEKLLKRIFDVATGSGDIVLDSFAGSGTTGAVAQKMGRQWIMVEIGDHADTHIVPRLKKVIDGTDQGGISKAVEWQGGGSFSYYTLAPSLMEKDHWGNWVVAKEYDANMLAAAVCKHLGFDYAPSTDEAEWWRHGQSSETDFLYVTTQSLTRDALKLLSDEIGEERSLMICAPAFSGSFDDFDNLSCTKIPSAILSRCEWGRDDYSLNVSDPVPDEDQDVPDEGEVA